MALEIEKKFLIANDEWRQHIEKSIRMRQRYLPLRGEKHSSARVRITGDHAYLTLKTHRTAQIRSEFEYEIPPADAENIFQNICEGAAIEKTRHIVMYEGFRWEIDEFYGDNAGLTVAEIELAFADQSFPLPPWIGKEVSGDFRYTNSALTKNPYCKWNSGAGTR